MPGTRASQELRPAGRVPSLPAGRSLCSVVREAPGPAATQQAADSLNVSRPYLIGLLEAGKIPYTMVGAHRRVAVVDLLEYKRKDDQHRRNILDQLTELSEELEED
jgi:excisionase family DNA binding protein